jgi:hypothetical protein
MTAENKRTLRRRFADAFWRINDGKARRPSQTSDLRAEPTKQDATRYDDHLGGYGPPLEWPPGQ